MIKQKISQWPINLSKKLSRQGLYPFLEAEFAKIPAQATVLTVGSGGPVNEYLQKYGTQNHFAILSLDIDPKRQPDWVGDICSYDFESQQFDVVVMSEVLEHVHAPHLALENVHTVLKENGRLILTTPFAFPLHDRPHDYFRFTKYGLQHLCRHFSTVTIKERNSYFEAIDVLWLRLWREQQKKARLISYIIIPLIYFVKRPFTWLLTKTIPADGLTTGYVVLAKK